MVCIEKRPYTLYGRLATLHFRYLTCLLDRGHISHCMQYSAVFFKVITLKTYVLNCYLFSCMAGSA